MEKVYQPTTITAWILATRPKTLTASLVPFVAGTALAASTGVHIKWLHYLCAQISAFFIQFAVNLINDAFDNKNKADTPERLGPLRALHYGVATPEQVYAAGMASLVLAFIAAIPLMLNGGLVLMLIVLISMLCAYIYTGGPYPLAYNGLGDIFVLVFYGWVSTMAGYWLQTGRISWLSFLLSTQVGLLCTIMIAVNNLRDIVGDAKVNKRTLPVRFGVAFGRFEIAVLTFVPFLLNFVWFYFGYTFTAAMPWLVFPLALTLVAKIYHTYPSQEYNHFLGLAALLHLTFGLLLTIGFMLD